MGQDRGDGPLGIIRLVLRVTCIYITSLLCNIDLAPWQSSISWIIEKTIDCRQSRFTSSAAAAAAISRSTSTQATYTSSALGCAATVFIFYYF